MNSQKGHAVSVLLCGVGGQGTILAADLLARCAMESGYDVKLSEVHGMAQRGGAVTTLVRFGDMVSSMVADCGTVDHIIAFETTEALRNITFLKSGGTLIVSDETIKPLPVLTGKASMPEEARETLLTQGALLVPTVELATKAGSSKASNVVLLGALSQFLPFDQDVWEKQIATRVPKKTIEMNKAAFRSGVVFGQGE